MSMLDFVSNFHPMFGEGHLHAILDVALDNDSAKAGLLEPIG